MSYIEAPARRIVIVVNGGCVESVMVQGVDLDGVSVFVVDYDNCDDDGAVTIHGGLCTIDSVSVDQDDDFDGESE